MTPTENLYYALGEIAYTIAFADGKVQREEMDRFSEIVNSGLQAGKPAYDISGIVFELLRKERHDVDTTYEWAMRELNNNSHYLTPEMKQAFLDTIKAVSEAFPPVGIKEKNLLENFKRDIAPLKGDPAYYSKK